MLLHVTLPDKIILDVLKSCLNPLSANFTKWSSTIKPFVDNLPTNCFNVFDNFVGLVLKGVKAKKK